MSICVAGSSGPQFKAGYAVAQAVGNLVQLVDGKAGLTERFHGLLRGLAKLGERLADLLRAGRLRLHALVDRLDPRSERLHLLNDLRQLAADS